MTWILTGDSVIKHRRGSQRFTHYRCRQCRKHACLPEGMTLLALGECSCQAARP